MKNISLRCASAFLGLGITAAMAQPAALVTPDIVTVEIDYPLNVLRISGTGFVGGGMAPRVYLGGAELAVVGSAASDHVVAEMPVPLPAGGYELRLERAVNHRSDSFDVTIGAIGAQGEQGPAGRGIASAAVVPSGNLYLTYSDGEVVDIGYVVGPDGPAGPQGAPGVAGPQGEVGPQGPAGATGAQGPKGDPGDTGPQGIQGVAGPQGEVGPQGPAGATGAQGAKGDPGDTGPQGVQGVAGPQGEVGPQGPAGATGAQGAKGDPGDTGPQGIQGVPGPQGEMGPQGPAGATGAQGAKGDPGDTGPQGVQGVPGPQGEVGPQGPAGATGAPGAKGDPGDTGPQGIQGVPGPQGEMGPEGPAGPPGASPWSLNGSVVHYLAGTVGIGTDSPSSALDVVGTVRMTGFQLGDTVPPGSVLTADVNGVGTWLPLPDSPIALPPNGAAGGDLAGSSYPDPVLAPGVVTTVKIANGAVTDAKVAPGIDYGKLVNTPAIPTSLPPNGAAGGDLAGSSYPDPVLAPGAVTTVKIANGAVTDAKVAAGIDYGKLVNTPAIPTSLPPNGAAGGDLAGSTYPNPVLAVGVVTAGKIASGAVGAGKLANDAASLGQVSGGAMRSTGSAIGIGTATPAAGRMLHVAGDVQTDGDLHLAPSRYITGDGALHIQSTGGPLHLNPWANDVYVGVSGGNGSVYISGNLAAGNGSVGTWTITGGLNVNSGATEMFGATPFLDFHYGSDPSDYVFRIINENPNQLSFRKGTSGQGLVYFDGDVTVQDDIRSEDIFITGTATKPGGGSWTATSDRRLKQDIRGLESSLSRLLELRGVSYEFKNPAAIGEKAGRHTGFVAQEVEQVFPEWVSERTDGYKQVTITGFEALTVEALRELHERQSRELASMREQLGNLESRNKELTSRLAGVLEERASMERRISAFERRLDGFDAERTTLPAVSRRSSP